jgi:tRNA A-37 threonylcarbamoyl transferase component Bud32
MSELGAGQVIETFRVTRLVAEGAMGQVYLAVDEQLGRRVALKFIKTGQLDVRALERFRDEARTTAQFNHPHIVTLYAAGVFRGQPWLALEYLDGQTLRERLAEGPLAVNEALRIGRAIVDALAEAHRRQIVHADLKPENVLVPRDGRVRVVDFGLARLVGGEATNGSGTPAYMAPERWTGGVPSPAMDVWALGVLLHEAIEGARPLSDAELAQLPYQPRPVRLGPRVAGSSCGSLIAECLRLDPHERPSASDVFQRLERLLAGRDVVEGRSPFRGLEAFTEADAADFQGREAELDAALERLRHDPLVPIVGPSGVGKSSFVFAGLVPRLKETGAWTVVSLRPGRTPWVSLATALGSSPNVLSAHLGGLVTELRRLSAGGARLLLVIDQFEELVTLATAGERDAVVRALSLAASPEEPWRVVVTLRADFLGAFAAVPELTDGLRSVLVLRPLSRAGLESAVRAPLARVGFTTDEPSLPARIAAELDGQSAALPLLQFACQALWDRRDAQRRVVLQREYDAMGGAVGALATHAQHLVTELLPEERRLTRALLLRLVNSDGTRRPRTRGELLDRQPEAAAVLDRLLTQRLVVSDRESDESEPLLELAHESLVSTWPELSRWLLETQESRALVQDIEQAAQLWDKRGRRESETWSEETLADILRRVGRWNVSLASVPREFLAAGQARQQRQLRRRRALQVGVFVTLSIIAATSVFAALEFRHKEREAIAQQEQIRLAAGDVGRFELVLEPFDWDAKAQRPVPVSAATLPALDWRLRAVSRTDPRELGPPVVGDRVRRGPRTVDADGHLREIIELASDPVIFEFSGRGEGCGPSTLVVKAMPGYADRVEPPEQIHFPVPTCQATRAGAVRLSQPDGGTFTLDATELSTEAWALYETLRPITGDERLVTPPLFRQPGVVGLPVVGIDAFAAERVCRFLGRRLPLAREWWRAATTHPQRTGARPVGPCRANLDGADDGFELLSPGGACTGDVTAEGVADLLGNVQEWMADEPPPEEDDNAYAGLRHLLGGQWAMPPDAPPTRLEYPNTTPPSRLEYGIGVRCASE